jgi:hypothetical protein
MKTTDICWLAGLLEGEGSFRIHGNGEGTLEVCVGMTDRDVILRAAQILGTSVDGPYFRPPHKPMYQARVYSSRAASWMMTIYSLMGERRKEKIRTILKKWLLLSTSTRAPRGTHRMATCHPDRPLVAKGLCRTCWMRQYRMAGGLRYRNPEPWVRKRSTKNDLV